MRLLLFPLAVRVGCQPGREDGLGRMDPRIRMAESLRCPYKTTATLLIRYVYTLSGSVMSDCLRLYGLLPGLQHVEALWGRQAENRGGRKMCSEPRNAACEGRGALRQGCGRGNGLKPGLDHLPPQPPPLAPPRLPYDQTPGASDLALLSAPPPLVTASCRWGNRANRMDRDK